MSPAPFPQNKDADAECNLFKESSFGTYVLVDGFVILITVKMRSLLLSNIVCNV